MGPLLSTNLIAIIRTPFYGYSLVVLWCCMTCLNQENYGIRRAIARVERMGLNPVLWDIYKKV